MTDAGNSVFKKVPGFSLIEMMIALAILAFGLLAVGPLLYVAASSGSLARSKDGAAVAAQSKLDFLAGLYCQNPAASELTLGDHGPQQAEVTNPVDETLLNRFSLIWTISRVPDPRPSKALNARMVRVTVTPISSGGERNYRAAFNKILNVTTILSPEMP